MADIKSKEKAILLRKKGCSINEIARVLNKSKGTVSYWCRDIVLSKEQEQKLIKKSRQAGVKKFIEYHKAKRKERLKEEKEELSKGREDVGFLSKRDLFVVGLALYWGEGYKKGNDECGFTNSAPFIIKMILLWFQEIYSISNERFTLRVSINESHKNRDKEIICFWSHYTGIPSSQFTKTSFIKTKTQKQYSNHKNYYGTLRVKIKKGANIRRRIMGSISALENASP